MTQYDIKMILEFPTKTPCALESIKGMLRRVLGDEGLKPGGGYPGMLLVGSAEVTEVPPLPPPTTSFGPGAQFKMTSGCFEGNLLTIYKLACSSNYRLLHNGMEEWNHLTSTLEELSEYLSNRFLYDGVSEVILVNVGDTTTQSVEWNGRVEL